MIRKLTNAALETPTSKQYNAALSDYFEFCDLFHKDPLSPSPRKVQEFLCYLHFYLDIPHGAADKRVTALGHFWLLNGYNWDRKKYPTIRTMMKGYKKLKPSDIRRKNPFTIVHMQKAFKWIKLNSYNGLLIASVLCIGYFFGGRVGEYAPKSRDQWKEVVRPKDLTFIGPKRKLKALIIDFRQHKTNKHGIYSGKVECVCSCDIGICPVHIIKSFIDKREKEYGSAEQAPLLLTLEEKPIRSTQVNFAVKNFVAKMKLNPKEYSSHSLRSGRATDLARTLKPNWFIKKWGRWRSDCWENFYAKLDFTDIAIIANKSLHELGLLDNKTL